MSDQEKQRLKTLEEENYCLREIIQHVSEGVILTDRECRITIFNPAKEQMEQMSAKNILGQVSWDAYSHSSKERSEHKQVFDSGIPILRAYRPHAYVGEIPVYIDYSTYPVIRNGETIGVYSICRNETILRELLYETIEHRRQTQEEPKQSELAGLAQGTHFTFSDIVGSSDAMRSLLREAQTVATLSTPVLITGETGTGKEVLAQSIHNLGRERQKFVGINCAAVPETLVESVLFGTVKGAYTGAMDSPGLFREAGEGTLFLDEINSMSVGMQAKLLRALQERSVRPVGGTREYPIRCRLICASNENAEVLLQEGRMRRDLFYRIAGFCLSIPPLRERTGDILEQAVLFIRRYNREFGKQVSQMAPDLEQWFLTAPWPGNTRELQNVVQNMMIRVGETEETVSLDHLPPYARPQRAPVQTVPEEGPWDLNGLLRDYQKEIVLRALEEKDWNITQAAAALGIGRQNLTERMKRLGIRKPS